MRSCAPEVRVLDSDQKLRHLPFFEEVAGSEAESSEWHAATAGLVTLRLVDAWLEGGLSLKDNDWSVPHVRKAVRAMDEGTPIRSMLLRVVDALRPRKPDIHVLVTQLMAYAQALEYEAKWSLAADVYQTTLAHLHPIEDSEASISAHIRLAVCYRTLHQLDQATAAYAAAAEIGTAVNDLVGILRARIGEASLARLRGDLPDAEVILDDAIARAKGADLQEVRARALNERSGVAILSGQYELGIRLAYDALGQTHSEIERDRILNNIATAFVNLGVYTAARDAYLVLSATAQEQYMRWTATINLIDVSSLTGSQVLFEQHRRELAGAALDPHLETGFEITLGVGRHRFGDDESARQHLQRAMLLAEEHGLNQFLIEAETALADLGTPTPPLRTPAVSLDVEEVAMAIRSLRESAGVG
jgi:tetratricopeptide (TPR) repeat protein